MEFLRFIFSNFWVWLGFVILVAIVGGVLVETVKACKRNRKVTAYRIGQRWHITVENASRRDAQAAITSTDYNVNSANAGADRNGEGDAEEGANV